MFFCFPYFESLHGPYCTVKRQVYQTLRKITVTCTPRIKKSGGNNNTRYIREKENDISHICVPLLQCRSSVVVSSSYCPSLCKYLSYGSLRQQKYVSSNFGCSKSFKQLYSKRTFSPQGLFFSSYIFQAFKDHCIHNQER